MSRQRTPSTAGNFMAFEEPLSLDAARHEIRNDFLALVALVKAGVKMADGHEFKDAGAWGIEHQLTWNLNCEIRSSEGGLSLFGGLVKSDDSDVEQINVEIRYHHKSLIFRNRIGKVCCARGDSKEHSAILWVNKGRPFAGMQHSLIGEDRYVRGETIEALASQIIDRITFGLERAKAIALANDAEHI